MSKRLPRNHDVVLSYQKSDEAFWNEDEMFQPYDEENLDEKTSSKYCHRDPDGRIYRLDSLINPNPNRPNLTYEFLTLEKITKPMRIEAVDAGNYAANLLDETKLYPKVQILTVKGLMEKTERLEAPPLARIFAKAEREAIRENQQTLV